MIARTDQLAYFMKHFPPEEEISQMAPEELAPFVLALLKKDGAQSGILNVHNFGIAVPNGPVGLCLMEAWAWLESEGFLGPKPGDSAGWMFITRKGAAITDSDGFAGYLQAAIFPRDLDSILVRVVRPMFLRGDYDTAVFRAFKEVEVRVRKKSGFTKEYGRGLMQRAFGPPGVLITGDGTNNDDQSAMRELFGGAISFCKNPSSHHEIQFENPREVVDMICFANQLLRIVDRLGVRAPGA